MQEEAACAHPHHPDLVVDHAEDLQVWSDASPLGGFAPQVVEAFLRIPFLTDSSPEDCLETADIVGDDADVRLLEEGRPCSGVLHLATDVPRPTFIDGATARSERTSLLETFEEEGEGAFLRLLIFLALLFSTHWVVGLVIAVSVATIA